MNRAIRLQKFRRDFALPEVLLVLLELLSGIRGLLYQDALVLYTCAPYSLVWGGDVVYHQEGPTSVGCIWYKCLRLICGIRMIRWSDFINNEELYRRTAQLPISTIIRQRRFGLFGHIAHLPENSEVRHLLMNEVSSSWRRPRGRHRLTWLRTIEQDLSRTISGCGFRGSCGRRLCAVEKSDHDLLYYAPTVAVCYQRKKKE